MTEIIALPAIAAADVSDDDLIVLFDIGAATQKSRKATRAHFLKDVVRTAGTFAVGLLNATVGFTAPEASIDTMTVNTALILGATVSKILSVSASVAIPDATAAAQSTVTMAVADAVVGDVVTISAPAGLPAGLILRGVVTAAGVVTIYAFNATSVTIAAASYSIRVMLVRFA